MFKPSFCANENCVKHKTRCGGQFRFVNGKEYCLECSANLSVPNSGKNLWDFTTSHFTGHPVHVKSRNHLDQLCKQHGVSNFARENNERNW